MAVDPSNGNVYVASDTSDPQPASTTPSGAELDEFETILSVRPASPSTPTGTSTCRTAAATSGGTGTTEEYDLVRATDLGTVDGNPSYGVCGRPADDHVYVDEGNRVVEFDSGRGHESDAHSARGVCSRVARRRRGGGQVVVANPHADEVAAFGPPILPHDLTPTTRSSSTASAPPATRNTADFQVTPSGDYAVFTSALSLTGYDNAGHREVFRYDAADRQPRYAPPATRPTSRRPARPLWPPNGLSLTDDGRVFFNSTEGLVDRDLNEKKDAYEWEPRDGIGQVAPRSEGCVQLISTGTGPSTSSLLGASADGSRRLLLHPRRPSPPSDHNGGRVKIYDARERRRLPVRAAAACHARRPTSATAPAAADAAAADDPQHAPGTPRRPGCLGTARRCGQFAGRARAVAKKRHASKARASRTGGRTTWLSADTGCRLLRRSALVLAAALDRAPRVRRPRSRERGDRRFTTTTSTTQAGGHPDLSTSFTLDSPGEPEAAQNVIFNAPEGIFGNPNAITHCTSSDFALDECPPNSQAGLITVYANYEGKPDHLLGTAPIFDIEPQTGADGALRLHRADPRTSRSTSRSRSEPAVRLRPAVHGSEITQLTPLSGADLTFWGFPADSSHDTQRFPKGAPGEPASCPGLADTGCVGQPTPASIPVAPAHRQPDHLHRASR